MLTFAACNSSAKGGAEYYSQQGAGEYYGVLDGVWHGKGAAALGLSGPVHRIDFERVLAGQDSLGRQLVRRQQATSPVPASAAAEQSGSSTEPASPDTAKATRKECFAYDLTASLAKSASILAAVSDDVTRCAIEAAMLAAARKTIDDLVKKVPLARRGREGRKVHAEPVVAMFRDTLSRAGEPQLHVHCVVTNMGLGEDGKWSTLNSFELRRWVRAFGPVFRCHFARELRERLSVGIELTRRADGRPQSSFEITGIPQTLIDYFSSRRRDIERATDDYGGNVGGAAARRRQNANLATRRKKQRHRSEAELRAGWISEARRLGFGPKELAAVLSHEPAPQVDWEAAFERALMTSLRRITVSESHFSECRLLQEVCEELQHLGMPGTNVIARLEHALQHHPEIAVLQELGGVRQYSTKTVVQLEAETLQMSQALRQQIGPRVPTRQLNKALRAAALSPEQEQAVRALLSDPTRLRTFRGVAGAGKSHCLDAVRRGFEAAGYRVVGAALSGAAKEELRAQSGIASRTIASYLYHLEQPISQALRDRLWHDARMLSRAAQGKPTYHMPKVALDKKTVLVLDEAGMVDTSTLHRVLKQVQAAGASILLVGDWRQLPPIQAGTPFRELAKSPTAKLETNRRQRDPRDREAVKLIAAGNVKEAFDNYLERGRLKTARDRETTLARLVETWARRGGVKAPRDHLILTQTRRDAQEINRRCQTERSKRFRLVPSASVRHGQERFRIGDRVLFHEAYRKVGVENGHFGTVLGVDPFRKRLFVRLDIRPQRRTWKQPASKNVWIPLKAFSRDGVGLGYAATTHKIQGRTIDHSYVLLDGALTSREMLYTQATRARKSTRLFVNRQLAGAELKDLIESANRSRGKLMAHEIGLKSDSRRLAATPLRYDGQTEMAIRQRTAKPAITPEAKPAVKPAVKPTKQPKLKPTLRMDL